jgi:hypothetical protein
MQIIVEENFGRECEVWERLERARTAKAAQGGYAGYGSPAFGQQSIDGELIENSDEQQRFYPHTQY